MVSIARNSATTARRDEANTRRRGVGMDGEARRAATSRPGGVGIAPPPERVLRRNERTRLNYPLQQDRLRRLDLRGEQCYREVERAVRHEYERQGAATALIQVGEEAP